MLEVQEIIGLPFLRQVFFHICLVLGKLIKERKNKNIGDLNYGNEGHLEQNVESRGTFT